MKRVVTISRGKESKNHTLSEADFNILQGKKIGDKVKLSLSDFELMITGGSTDTGTPIHKSFSERVYKKTKIGRKYGNVIDNNIVQINLKEVVE